MRRSRYYTLFALAPLLIVAISIAGLVFGAGGRPGAHRGRAVGSRGRERGGGRQRADREQPQARDRDPGLRRGPGDAAARRHGSLRRAPERAQPRVGSGDAAERLLGPGARPPGGVSPSCSRWDSCSCRRSSSAPRSRRPGGCSPASCRIRWHWCRPPTPRLSLVVITVLFALIFKLLPGHPGGVGRRLDRGGDDVGALHAGQVRDRPVPGPERPHLDLRRGGVRRGARRLGLLLRADLLFRCGADPGVRANPRLSSSGGRASERRGEM